MPSDASPRPAAHRRPLDGRLALRATLALLTANVRYWSSVWPTVRKQLKRWETAARQIPDPQLRALALEKLHDERFNAEVASTLAVVAPRRQRRQAVQAMVALQVMYDYLDGLTERPASEPLRNGRRLFGAFLDAVNPVSEPTGDYYRYCAHKQDGGYLKLLAETVKDTVVSLPSAEAVAAAIRDSALRCSVAQTRVHAAAQPQSNVEAWARRQAQEPALDWRVFLAGAMASVLCMHALIATAAAPGATAQQASELDTAYLFIAAFSTMLDSLTDRPHDTATEATWYLDQWQDGQLGEQMADLASQATAHAKALPSGPHHVMTLVGVVAYYTSAPTAGEPAVRRHVTTLQRELQPLLAPTLAVMRAWRLAKRLRRRAR